MVTGCTRKSNKLCFNAPKIISFQAKRPIVSALSACSIVTAPSRSFRARRNALSALVKSTDKSSSGFLIATPMTDSAVSESNGFTIRSAIATLSTCAVSNNSSLVSPGNNTAYSVAVIRAKAIPSKTDNLALRILATCLTILSRAV